MPFRTALSGLNAATADLRVTGNNIANSGTVGFKQSRAEFADVFALSYSGISQNAVGAGVRLSAVTQQFNQGNVDFTGNNLDLAVNGQGFFVLSDGGSQVFSAPAPTRSIATASWSTPRASACNPTRLRTPPAPPSTPACSAISSWMRRNPPPQATSRVTATLNLSSEAEDLSALPFDPGDPNTFTYTTSLTTYDSLGQAHTGTMYFRNIGALQWESHFAIDGVMVGGAQPMTSTPTARSPRR
jgi:flagellar hook protein FlgE